MTVQSETLEHRWAKRGESSLRNLKNTPMKKLGTYDCGKIHRKKGKKKKTKLKELMDLI